MYNNHNEVIVFYFARALGLIVKPLTLWFLLKINAEDESYFVATYYFLVAATFVVLNSEAHIPFYKLRFGGGAVDTSIRAHVFRSYMGGLICHVYVFLPVIFVGFLFYFSSFLPALVFTVFVLMEKIWDEIQRDLIFSRRYLDWSIWFVVKAVVPSIAIMIAFWLDWNMYICLGFFLLISGVVNVYRFIPKRMLLIIVCICRRMLHCTITAYFTMYRQRFGVAQVIAITSINLLNVDKWLVGGMNSERLMIELVLMAQVGTIYIVMIDNVFFSRSRDLYVKSKACISDITRWPLMLKISIGYLAISMIMLFSFREYLGIEQLSFMQTVVVSLCFVVVGVTRPLAEHAFWHVPRKYAAMIDASIILIMLLFGYIFMREGNLLLMLISNLVFIGVRMACYAMLCQKTFVADTRS